LPILAEEEKQQLVHEWNQTEAEYPREKCVHELFEEQVEKSAEAAALVYEDVVLTYAELNRRANRLAHYLRELGVKPDDRVGICLERGIEMVVALLAVLKAGEPIYPWTRVIPRNV